jgi:Surfeit locus protein 5 subunit 22 of Mediator complex
VRAAEDLLAVTQKLKQLWILAEGHENQGDANEGGAEDPLDVSDIAETILKILWKEKDT